MLAAQPIGWWAFDNAANIGDDSSANNSDLTAGNDPEYTASGHTGGGLALDGAADTTGDFLTGAPANLPTANSPYTLSAWVKPTGSTFGTRGGIVGWGNFSGTRSAIGFRLSASNGLFHTWSNVPLNATDAQVNAYGIDLDGGAWHHVVASYDGSMRSIWVDGNLINSDAQTTPNAATAANFRIGIANSTSSAGDYFKGTMDDVAIWNVALAPNQIGALAGGTRPDSLPEAGTGLLAHWRADDLNATLDSGDPLAAWGDTIGGVNAAPSGRPLLQKNVVNGHSTVRFDPTDGDSDQLRVDAATSPMAGRTTFTVAVVFRADEPGVGGATNWFDNTGIVDADQAGVVNDWGVSLDSVGRVGAGVGNPDRSLYSSGQVNLADGLPHLAIVSRSGSTLSLSIDGLPPVTRGDAPVTTRGTLDMVFGSLATNSNYFSGDLAEVQVYSTALSTAQRDALAEQLLQTYGITPTIPPIAVAGDVLVDLRATDPTASAPAWRNLGTLGGTFTRVGNPPVQDISGTLGVALNFDHPSGGWDDAFQGPLAPASLTGAATRTIEIWSYNPSDGQQQGEETAVAWGRRGGPGGSNLTFGHGNHPTWGAVGHWDAPDMPWFAAGGSPSLGQWHHLVYTYDGNTARLYADGVPTYSEVVGVLGTHTGTTINLGAQNGGAGALSLAEGQPGSLALANVRIHTGVLSASDVLGNFQAGVQLFSNPPVATNDSHTVNEDGVLIVPAATGVLSNDNNPGGQPMTAVLDVGPLHGTIDLSPNGSFTYQPNANYFGSDSFTYHAVAAGLPSNVATVQITVSPQYDPVVAVADSFLVDAGVNFSVNAASGVLANDVNVDQATLQASLVSPVTSGTLNLAANGSFTYQGGAVGTQSFSYRVFDGTGNSNTVVVTLTVDTPPVADNEAYQVDEDQPLTIAAAQGVLVGDTDAESNPLTASVVTPPSFGQLSLAADGSFVYTPSDNFSGADSFTYRASDGDQFSDPASVAITVRAVNDAPLAQIDTYFGFLNQPLVVATSFGVLANDQDVDGPAVSAVLVDAPLHGTLNLNANGSFTYTPATGFTGTDSFTYKATDSLVESEVVAVSLIVNPPDQQVVINEIHYDPDENNIPEEFIELFNAGTTTVNLSGWYFSDGIEYTIPPGVSLAAGQYLLIAENPAVIQSRYGVAALGPWVGSLNNEGEELVLRNGLGNRVDQVDYNVGFPWPLASEGTGSSMELIHPSLDNDLGGSWRASQESGESRPPVTLLGATAANWRYRKGTSEASSPTSAWRQPGFIEDASWLTGRTSIGYADGDDNTTLTDMMGSYWSVYLRNQFTVPAGPLPTELLLRVYHDDGAIVWINGVEAARVSVTPGEKAFNSPSGAGHEAAWSQVLLTNLAQYNIAAGSNTIAVHVLNETLASSDLSIDAEVIIPGIEPAARPTPAAQNSVYATNAPPQIRQVNHAVATPMAGQTNTITAKVTDPGGVASVQLHYQFVLPGAYVPATLPVPIATLQSNPDAPRPVNPAFEDPANWTTIAMRDDGTNGDAVAGDSIYSANVPGQINRTLVRYRITVADTFGASVRVPYADDDSLNFAYYVYDGVPAYQGPSGGFSSEVLNSLPVYSLITRSGDMCQALAHSPGPCAADQISQFLGGGENPARFVENWEAAMVYDGFVYDHIHYRLGGANGRYLGTGKRNMRFRFNDGNLFRAKEQDGDRYPERWKWLATGDNISNRMTLTYGVNEALNYHLWDALGVPSADSHFFHFRVVDGVDEAPDPYHGDFWGMGWAQENYDVHFLEAHDLPKGNLYKLINSTDDPLEQERYLAADAVRDGSDHNNIEFNLRSSQSIDWLKSHVNYPAWYRYHALSQAIRHYDYWPSANKNAIWYFEPPYSAANTGYGRMWTLPWDSDSTWGPTYNLGEDRPYDAIFPSADGRGDPGGHPAMQREYRNAVRELRDLLWVPEQINGIIDSFAADIDQFVPADRARWNGAPPDAGNYAALVNNFDLAGYVQDLKNFAFVGGTWPPGVGEGSVGAGGRAAFLDSLQASGGDGPLIPTTPTITYAGAANFPVDGLAFQSSAFADPQGSTTFAAMEWRLAEITDPAAPGYDPTDRFKLEVEAEWQSGELTTFNNTIAIPVGEADAGKTYRARVRMMDTSGVWSHWSAPVQFTTSSPANTPMLLAHLRVTEVMYNPPPATLAEQAAGFTDQDFEYIELFNTGTQPLNLSGVHFTTGLDFDFTGGDVSSLAPGAYVVVGRNRAALEIRYGGGLPIAGEFTGGTGLANNGETIGLADVGDTVILEFAFDDTSETWHPSTDGEGPSLVILDPLGAVASWSDGPSWRPSHETAGSPGEKDLLMGDMDQNDRVDLRDLAILHSNIGTTSGATRAMGDLTRDGAVNRDDLVRFVAAYGRSVAPPAGPGAGCRRGHRWAGGRAR